MNISLLILLQFVMASGPRSEIRIHPSVRLTQGLPVRIKDVAQISFAPVESVKAAGDIVLYSQSQRMGSSLVGSDLAKLIKRELLDDPKTSRVPWTFFVPNQVQIEIQDFYVNPNTIEHDVSLAVQEKCLDCEITIKDLRIPQVQKSGDFLSWDIDLSSIQKPGPFLMPLSIKTSKGNKNYWVSGYARAIRSIFVTAKKIERLARIEESDLKLELFDVTQMNDRPLDKSELVGKKINMIRQLGQPIFRSDLYKELAIRRGQEVKAIFSHELFEVSGQMMAEEQGYLGDVIKLKNPESKKIVSGKIIHDGVVEIE